jgi:prophage regulatory protein
MHDKLLRRPEVEAITGLSRSTIYLWLKQGKFPKPVKIGARVVAWRDRHIADWMDQLDDEVEP